MNDTLEYAFACAEQVFGAEFTQDHVLAIYDRMVAKNEQNEKMERIEAKRVVRKRK